MHEFKRPGRLPIQGGGLPCERSGLRVHENRPPEVGHGGISIAFKIAYKDTSHAEGAADSSDCASGGNKGLSQKQLPFLRRISDEALCLQMQQLGPRRWGAQGLGTSQAFGQVPGQLALCGHEELSGKDHGPPQGFGSGLTLSFLP